MPSPDPSPSFTWNAADYHKSSPAQHQWAQELIAKPGLSGTSRVLDNGCGNGKITAEIARNLPEGSVTGMDSSPPPSSPSDITDEILSQTTLYISVDPGFYWNTKKSLTRPNHQTCHGQPNRLFSVSLNLVTTAADEEIRISDAQNRPSFHLNHTRPPNPFVFASQ